MKLDELIESMPATGVMAGLEAIAERDAVTWCALNRRIKGEPMLFDNSNKLRPEALEPIKRTMIKSDYESELYARLLHHRPFLKQPLRDTHPHQAFEKGRQIGVSELVLCKELHFLATHPGTKSIHTFPRDAQLAQFSVTRIAPAFDESPRMRALIGVPNQVMTKRIGDSYMILRSAWESNLGEGVDADMVILDEKDRMRDKVELAFRESLKSSRHHIMLELSTPSLPGQGIDAPFRDSDQRVWMVKCEKCSDWQEVTWTENIVQVKDVPMGARELQPESYEYRCRKLSCRGPLDRVYSGRWVARYPDRHLIRGYHLPQLIAPWLSATQVMQDKINFKWIQPWLNYVCGLPAAGENVMLTDADFEQACAGHDFVTGRTRDWTQITAGIDWGYLNWVVVHGRNVHNQRLYLLNIGVFEDDHQEELRSVKAVENFLAPYQADLVVADAGYGKDRNAYLMRKMSPNGEGRFYAQWYNPSQKQSRTFQPEWSDPSRGRVLVDRTMQIKNICRAIKEREFGIPNLGMEKVQLMKRHFRALAPLKEIDEETKEMVETISKSGDDHLVHACASSYLAQEKLSKTSRFGFSFE